MSTNTIQQSDDLMQPYRFDFLTNIVNSSSLINNQSIQPKIIKMLDTVQTYLDLNNEKLVEHLSKQREHETLDLTKKSNDLNHRQKLQSLLVESIDNNDFRKANFIHTCLHANETNATNFLNNNDTTTATTTCDYETQIENDYNNNSIDYNFEPTEAFESSTASSLSLSNNNGYKMEDNYEENSLNNNSNNNIGGGGTTSFSSEYINLNDSIRDAFTKAKKSNPLSPIRHLICSPGLELKAQNCKIIILYRGKCNGICYQNKPWSKEMHIHYIINTVNCNDHVSRLVKKQGIQFYNSFVLQNQERIKQLIQMYKMEKV
jgi:hypothetical protein